MTSQPKHAPWHWRHRAAEITCPWDFATELAYAIGDALSPWGLTALTNPEWRGPREGLVPVAAALAVRERVVVGLCVRGPLLPSVSRGDAPEDVLDSNGRGITLSIERGELHVRLWATAPLEVYAVEVYVPTTERPRFPLAHPKGIRMLPVPFVLVGRLHITVPLTAGWGVPPVEPKPEVQPAPPVAPFTTIGGSHAGG